MKRILCGTVLSAAAVLFAGCKGESAGVKGGTPDHLSASPTTMILPIGDSQAVQVSLVDQNGVAFGIDQYPITVANSGSASTINLRFDSLFQPIYGTDGVLHPNAKATRLQYVVRGDGLDTTSVTFNAGGKTLTLPIAITPLAMAATVNPAAAKVNDTVTITAGASFAFGATAAASAQTATSGTIVSSIPSADGTTLKILPVPGFNGQLQASGVKVTYSPSLSLTLPITNSNLTVDTTTGGFTGVDAFATAPTLPLPTGAQVFDYFDLGTMPFTSDVFSDGGRLYKVTVPADTKYEFTLTYTGGKDMGIYYYDGTQAPQGPIADNNGNGSGASPEDGTVTLTAGTYYIVVDYFNYGPQVLPPFFRLTIKVAQ